MIIVDITLSILWAILMAIFPVIQQGKVYIDDTPFRLIKIKKLSFLFWGVGRQSSSKHGVILSMFCVQIMGYVLALLTPATIIVLYWVFKIDNKIISWVVCGVWVFEIVAFFATQIITDKVSKRRINNNYKPPKAKSRKI